ncbi:MAG TPA: hypothetical protein VM510_14050, partial [Caulifigura sp.]|nr:hypothetical protein [Caulifigura sp.]
LSAGWKRPAQVRVFLRACGATRVFGNPRRLPLPLGETQIDQIPRINTIGTVDNTGQPDKIGV